MDGHSYLFHDNKSPISTISGQDETLKFQLTIFFTLNHIEKRQLLVRKRKTTLYKNLQKVVFSHKLYAFYSKEKELSFLFKSINCSFVTGICNIPDNKLIIRSTLCESNTPIALGSAH